MTRRLQGALIGFGFIAEKGHVPAYLAAPHLFEIVAVAEVCAARRERARQVLPKARIYCFSPLTLKREGDSGAIQFGEPAATKLTIYAMTPLRRHLRRTARPSTRSFTTSA